MKITQAGLQAVQTDDFLIGLLNTAEEFRKAGRSHDEAYTALSGIIALRLTNKEMTVWSATRFMNKNRRLIRGVIREAFDLGRELAVRR
jgi:hypothetical protein